jgi:hypothetical protein
MLRFARFLSYAPMVAALALGTLPAAALAQAGTPAEPALERRTVPAATMPEAARAESDPWLMSYIGLGGRTARTNLSQLDRALEPYGATYTRLDAEARGRIRQAFDDVIPSQRFSRYPVSAPQARAIVYLALGPVDRVDTGCDRDRPRRRNGPTRCDQAIDSMGRDAAWIHSTILALGRTGNRRPREQELGALRDMNERARGMAVGGSGCGCSAARDDAEELLAGIRDAIDAYDRSSMPAWMSLGDQRVQRIARLSDSLERTFIRCLSDG